MAFGLVLLGNHTGWWTIDIQTMIFMVGTIVTLVGSSFAIPPTLRDRLRHVNDEVLEVGGLVYQDPKATQRLIDIRKAQ